MKTMQRGVGISHRVIMSAAAGVLLSLACVTGASADISIPPVTVGAGIQTGFYNCDKACIDSPGTITSGDSVSGFAVDSIRLYVNGSVTDKIKLTFDTEYSGTGTNHVNVLDAIGRFEFSDQFNIWAGRLLPPTDRANLYGPYYANDWAPYADRVADFYPDVATGRDNGIAYWGQFGMLKVSVGAFDGESLNSAVPDHSKLLYAGRLMLDFWDPEAGYYLNGTYYGDKDLLAVGLVAQSQNSRTAAGLDALMEKKLANFGVITVEAEYQHDNGLTTAAHNNGWYGLASYLFPQQLGIGKIQVLGKYSQKTIDTLLAGEELTPSDKLKTEEFNLNYIIKSFNARVGLYFLHQKDDLGNFSPHEIGVKLQLQI